MHSSDSSQEDPLSLVAKGSDLLLRIPSSERALWSEMAGSSNSMVSSMLDMCSAITLQCAIRAHAARAACRSLRAIKTRAATAKDQDPVPELKPAMQGEVQVLCLDQESDNDSRPTTPPLPAANEDEGSRPPTPPLLLDASESKEKNSSRAGSATSTRSRASVAMVRAASNSASTLLIPVVVSADTHAHDKEDLVHFERSCTGSATDSLGPYLDVAAEAVEETVDAAAQAVQVQDSAPRGLVPESEQKLANDATLQPSENVASVECAPTEDGAVAITQNPIVLQEKDEQDMVPVDLGVGADQEQVLTSGAMEDVAAGEMQSAGIVLEAEPAQDAVDSRSVPLGVQATRQEPEEEGEGGEYDVETFEDEGDAEGQEGGENKEDGDGESYSDDAEVENEASQPRGQDADEYTDDDFEDVHEVEGELKKDQGRREVVGKELAVQKESEQVTPDFENEEYDDFEDDDTAQSPLNTNFKEYDSDYLSDTDVESRGNTALSGATTLPRTRRATQHGSRARTGASDISATSTNTFTVPRRAYLESVDGQLIRTPGAREIQWELPKSEKGLEEWPLISSVYPASGVSGFPSVDALILPEMLTVNDEECEEGPPLRKGKEQKPKDKLDPQYRKRINLFLGINEWPPPAVSPPTPPAPPISNFIAKWYEILSSGLHSRYLKWTRQGTAFVLQDPLGFQEFVLPTYFKPAVKTRSGIGSIDGYNFPRIIKALRDHGFTRVDRNDNESLEFWHRFFVAGAPENLHRIKIQNRGELVDGELALVLPRPWTPIPMPGDELPVTHPLYHMTCPETVPLPHGAEYSRSCIYQHVARPGTTATRTLPKIKVLEKHNAEVQAALQQENKGKLASLFAGLVKDVHETKINSGAAKRVRQVRNRQDKVVVVKKEEVLVGPDLFPAKIGMRVKLSTAGRENKELDDEAPHEIGMILEIEPDGRLCQVKWQTGEEEWCCTGFSNKYYLQAFIIAKDTDGANSELWLKAAKFSPKWDLLDGVWKMNRLKSRLKMSTHSLRHEAAQDKLLKTIREDVRKYHVKLRAEEARRLEAEKMAKKQQKQKKSKVRMPAAVDQATPKIGEE